MPPRHQPPWRGDRGVTVRSGGGSEPGSSAKAAIYDTPRRDAERFAKVSSHCGEEGESWFAYGLLPAV